MLAAESAECVRAGRRVEFSLERGFYLYVGSAFGPGGLRARITHHQGVSPRPHWHIDHLRARTQLEAVWFTFDPLRREHGWAEVAGAMPAATAVPGFGASDCSCATHLFRFAHAPSRQTFSRRVRARFPGHLEIHLQRPRG